MLDQDRGYYRRRIAQERAAAESATCPQVRAVHLKLLAVYMGRLRRTASASTAESYSAPPRGSRSVAAASSMAVSSSPKHAV